LNYQKKLLLLIVISTIARLIIASTIELANDEVYYWTYALKLQWNYFDHPPLIGWLIRLTTANLLLHNELFVRLGAVISSAICTWLIFRIGTVVNNLQTGWFAALLYTSSIYGSLVAGTFIMPDSPQMVFWFASILLLLKISRSTANDPKSNLLWCLFGILSGLCIMSKVHGLFLWFGVVLYALLINRDWLKHRGIYFSAMITLIIVSPVIIWNVQNNFISYQFHSSRISLIGAGIQTNRFVKELFAVIVTNNPINFFLIYINLWWAFKGKLLVSKKDIQLLLFCSLPLIVVLQFISLFRETIAHWPGPAYSCLLVLPAIKLASVSKKKTRYIPNVIKLSLVYSIIIAVSEIILINDFPGTLSQQKEGIKTGTDDVTVDMYGWKEAGEKFDSLYKNDLAKKTMPSGAPIIVTSWFPAAHIDFYIASKTKQQTIAMGNVLNLHQYYWMNKYKKQLKNGDSAYYIVPSNLFTYKNLGEVTNRFTRYDVPYTIPLFRGGVICKKLYVFRVKGYKFKPIINYNNAKK